MNHSEILLEYGRTQKIGQGLTSTVYKGLNQNKEEICLKVIDSKFYSKPIGKLLIDNEISILNELNHKNLLKLLKHVKKQNQNINIIITEYCQGGNLYQMMKKQKVFKQSHMLSIISGILNGLEQLYNKNIIHRDLKPQNIFFKNGQPIIADFGFAVEKNNIKLNKVNAGSPLYMPPQSLKSLEFSTQSDIFAVGIMMYEMLNGKTPWGGASQKQLLENMLKYKPKIQLKNKQLQNIILKCLQPDKQKRIKFQQLLKFILQGKHNIYNQEKKKSINLSLNLKQLHNRKIDKNSSNRDVKQIKQAKNIYKIPKSAIKNKENKENYLNLSFNKDQKDAKTNRVLVQINSINKSCILQDMNSQKTKRNKSQKIDEDFKNILIRLDPQKMKFLPSSMIQKFKFILDCYIKIVQTAQNNSNTQMNNQRVNQNSKSKFPLILRDDKSIKQILQCKQQRQLCKSINGYIGRMYRLAKNYKIYKQFMKDIQILYLRVQSLGA